VDGEFTMKYFRRSTVLTASGRKEKVWLEPANQNYKPIYPEHSLNVIAILKAVIRKY
jgi:SOS-response transcriptional repressor LexA